MCAHARPATAPCSPALPPPTVAQRLRLLPRTTGPDGITFAEVRRALGAAELLDRTARAHPEWGVFYITVADALLDYETGDARTAADEFVTELSKVQRRAGIPQLSLHILETVRGLHWNILAVGTSGVIRRLCERPRFAPYLRKGWGKGKAAQIVRSSAEHLAASYLLKERDDDADARTATEGLRLNPRASDGPFLLPGGGDRVRLSRQLKAEAIRVGLVDPWQGTNANRRDNRARRS